MKESGNLRVTWLRAQSGAATVIEASEVMFEGSWLICKQRGEPVHMAIPSHIVESVELRREKTPDPEPMVAVR